MNNNTKFEYKQVKSDMILSDEFYQRPIDMRRVKKMANNYNPNLLNPVKVSFREGKYYVFDGQHTLAMLKMINGDPCAVGCKIYRGLSREDEARLFAAQNGISRSVESIEKFKALYAAGDAEICEMVRLIELAGLKMDFNKGKADNRVVAVVKAHKIFMEIPSDKFLEIFSLIKETWNGISESLNSEIIGGVYHFIQTYPDEYNRKLFIKQLGKVSPTVIIREGNVFNEGADRRYAVQILNYYNKGIRRGKLENKFMAL